MQLGLGFGAWGLGYVTIVARQGHITWQTHLTFVLDGGIEAVVQTLALEVNLIHRRDSGQKGIR